ncbi:MarR family transcriptional regulator [Clostridia bacterium]|nr:MarR family transcriptional regulator [Clostridia bacterium]
MDEKNDKSYIQQAVLAFGEVRSSNQLDMMERMNRANKGELFVLHFLAMRGVAALPSELSAALHSSTGRISALLGTLEKKGQIERNIDTSNRRNILVTLTEAGRARAETEMKKRRDGMTQTFAEMGETDTLEFIRLMKRFFSISQKHMIECGEEDESARGG